MNPLRRYPFLALALLVGAAALLETPPAGAKVPAVATYGVKGAWVDFSDEMVGGVDAYNTPCGQETRDTTLAMVQTWRKIKVARDQLVLISVEGEAHGFAYVRRADDGNQVTAIDMTDGLSVGVLVIDKGPRKWAQMSIVYTDLGCAVWAIATLRRK